MDPSIPLDHGPAPGTRPHSDHPRATTETIGRSRPG